MVTGCRQWSASRHGWRWFRLWFRNSYQLRRSYPGGWRSNRIYATYRGCRAVVVGIRLEQRSRAANSQEQPQ